MEMHRSKVSCRNLFEDTFVIKQDSNFEEQNNVNRICTFESETCTYNANNVYCTERLEKYGNSLINNGDKTEELQKRTNIPHHDCDDEQKKKSKEYMRKVREKIRSDPLLYAEAKRRDRERYWDRRKTGKVKLINELSESEKSRIRQQWRERSKRLYNAKKAMKKWKCQVQDYTPPLTPPQEKQNFIHHEASFQHEKSTNNGRDSLLAKQNICCLKSVRNQNVLEKRIEMPMGEQHVVQCGGILNSQEVIQKELNLPSKKQISIEYASDLRTQKSAEEESNLCWAFDSSNGGQTTNVELNYELNGSVRSHKRQQWRERNKALSNSMKEWKCQVQDYTPPLTPPRENHNFIYHNVSLEHEKLLNKKFQLEQQNICYPINLLNVANRRIEISLEEQNGIQYEKNSSNQEVFKEEIESSLEEANITEYSPELEIKTSPKVELDSYYVSDPENQNSSSNVIGTTLEDQLEIHCAETLNNTEVFKTEMASPVTEQNDIYSGKILNYKEVIKKETETPLEEQHVTHYADTLIRQELLKKEIEPPSEEYNVIHDLTNSRDIVSKNELIQLPEEQNIIQHGTDTNPQEVLMAEIQFLKKKLRDMERKNEIYQKVLSAIAKKVCDSPNTGINGVLRRLGIERNLVFDEALENEHGYNFQQ